MKKEELLQHLNDEDIQQKIIQIVSSKEMTNINHSNQKEEELMGIIKEWKQKYQKLKECLSSQEGKNQELEQTNKNLDNKILTQDTEISTLNGQNKDIQDQLDFYKQSFEDEIKVYEKFSSLKSATKDSLSGIFKNESLSGFISCGVQEKNIQNLWEYIKAEILEDKNSDIETLVEMFYFFFERYKMAYPMYELLETKQNDSFDTQLHIKHNTSSSSSGAISKVYLQGYKNIKTEKVVKQSIVKIG